MDNKINISIVQYGGMTYRTVIDLACRLDKDKFNATFFWCLPGKDLFSTFKHPTPTVNDLKLHIKKLIENKVNIVEFNVIERFIPDPNLPWRGTNFWELFNKTKTDVVFTWRGGRQEYPFCHIKKPIIEWNVFGFYDPTPNLFKTLAISPYCMDETILNGNKNVQVAFLPLNELRAKTDLREGLKIESGTIVLGMHQRVEDTIFDTHSLNAIKYVTENTTKKIKVVFLGGSEKYHKYSNALGLDGIFLEPTQDYSFVSQFLNTLDIYTHARKDGETLGASIQEAMFHKLPVISHTSQWNAHIDTLGPGGIVCASQDQYNKTLLLWVNNITTANQYGEKGYLFAKKRYTWEETLNIIENSFIEAQKMKLDDWQPLSVLMYRNRKYIYFLRYYLILTITFILVKVFGQKGSTILVKSKQKIKTIFK
jgi:glycosyltransferase involved in cell wall biosynthesis